MNWIGDWRHNVCTTVLAILLLVPAMLHADEDAGFRSILNYGAGNRALALGGAYGAIADDASAPLWNPGGLGLVARRHFEVSHASFFGMGFSEQYVSIAIPSWRWGTAGITFQRFGVDGIDVRDERNRVLSEDESDNETRIAFSYGKPIGEAWSVGGSFKLQRQSLLNVSATGVGLDLGAIARPGLVFGVRESWAHRFSVGLTLRNALEPSIRLVEDSVEDPTSLRLSFAHWHPIESGHAVLAAFDLEKTSGMGPRVHFGLEARLHNLVSVRAGLNQTTFTAGTGMQWRDAAFDYVFENNSIHAVHRFGVSYGFGLTVEESRRAALEAESAVLEAKVVEAFEKREAGRMERLLAEAESARKRQDFDQAIRILESIHVLDAANRQALALHVSYLMEKAAMLESSGDYAAAVVAYGQVLNLEPGTEAAQRGLEHARAESDRRAKRSAEIRKRFAEAMDAFSAENYAAARQGFQDILADNPGDQEAEAMLKRTREAMGLRVRGLLDSANRLAKAGNHGEAKTLLEQARQIDPNSTKVERTLAQVRALEEQELLQRKEAMPTDPVTVGQPSQTTPAAQTAEDPVPSTALSVEKQREVADLYRRGMTAMQAGQSEEALGYWELVWSTKPDYQQVGENLKREYLMRGMESFAVGELTQAISYWEKVLRIDPADQKAMGYMSRAQEQLNRTQQILGN